MRATEFIREYKEQPTEEFGGLRFRMIEGDDEVIVTAFDPSGSKEIGHVTFDASDMYDLEAQDLFIKDQYRGQGVAKLMYDFVKTHGYRINRSYDQTDAGSNFWDKHRGEERVWEAEELDEYRVTDRYDPTWLINRGNHQAKKGLDIIQTPLTDYNIRYSRDGDVHDYYLYDKSSDNCIGAFSIEENDDLPSAIKRLLVPGVQAVIPHMGLAPEAQRKGISTQAYSTFLRGGPWVFITEEHTVGASKLWDSLVRGDVVSLYVTQQGKVVAKPDANGYRLLGPRSRFKST